MEWDERTSDFLRTLNERVVPVLIRRLYKKGLMSIETKRLTRDILNIIGDGGFYSAAILNRKLEHLGWGKNIVDNYIFELIVYYLECEGTYNVERFSSIDSNINTDKTTKN